MKLVFVSNGPLPYHTPVLNELSDLTDLHVLHMSGGHPLGSFANVWGIEPEYNHTRYWSLSLGQQSADFRTQLSLGVSLRLRQLDPDVIFFSSWGPLAWEPLLWKRLARRKAVMWAESTSSSGLLRSRASDLARRLIVSQVDAFVTNGSKASAYLDALGVDAASIVTSRLPSVVPEDALARPEDNGASPSNDAPRYLFVGRLIPRKRPLELLQSFASVLAELPKATLTMVGDGPLMAEVSRAALPYGASVSLVGRAEGDALQPVYAQADILVLPAVREVWGLVVNEALAHGLYVIATDQVGSAHDLLDDASGAIVPADDSRALTATLVRAGRTIPRGRTARAARARRVSDCTPAALAKDIRRAATLALEGSAR